MSSSSSDVESLTTARGSVFSALTHKWKVALSVVLLLGAVAAVGVCAAVVMASTGYGGEGEGEGEQTSTRSVHGTGELVENVENEIIRNRRIPAHAEEAEFRPPSPCYSEVLNDTLPAAHIKGRGFEWQIDGEEYDAQWDCNTSLAFVSGGMWFEQEDKSIHVPKCGWYYISSDIAFQNNGQNASSYSYGLRVYRNCDSDRNQYFRQGHGVNSPVVGKLESITSVHINDVVKICRGGRIYVTIPVGINDCCPRGYAETTSLTAHLVSESDCQWPVPSHKHPMEPFQ